jgi:hypothetical protein
MHWTQTPSGRRKMSQQMKARHANKLAKREAAPLIQEENKPADFGFLLDDAISFCLEQSLSWKERYDTLRETKELIESTRIEKENA